MKVSIFFVDYEVAAVSFDCCEMEDHGFLWQINEES